MIRRFARDESGMTMGLAMIMILIIGVMGAGLLTFANTNLNTVVEANRGQRAFEVADAGVEAARRQLTSDCVGNNTCMTHYNNDEDDIQWSIAKGGLTLNNLDGIGTTADSVTVTIEYRQFQDATSDYKVISTGTYGDCSGLNPQCSKRKIEAIFKPITPGGGGGGNVINPAYYTPSDIRLSSDPTRSPKASRGVQITGMSLFSEGNIIIEGMLPYTSCPEPGGTLPSTCLKTDYENKNNGRDDGRISITGGHRVLDDWNSLEYDPPGYWNTIGRDARNGSEFKDPGFGAVGLICGGTPSTDPTDCDDPSDSIAEGRYAYDSTTGTRGQQHTFVDKQPIDDQCGTGPNCYGLNDPNTISFPFERREPDAARLKQLAINTEGWYRGSNPDWGTLLSGDRNRVVFIDAGDELDPEERLTLDGTGDNGTKKGIIVVWCGNFEMIDVNSFQGIIMTMEGQGDALPPDPETGELSSSCGPEKGRFEVSDSNLQAWFYAEGGDATDPGIHLGPGTSVDFLPSGSWKLLDLILEDAVPTSFEVQGWRELYQ